MINKRIVHLSVCNWVLLAICLSGMDACSRKTIGEPNDSESSDTESLFVGKPTSPQINWVKVSAGRFIFGAKEDAPCRSAFAENQSNVTLTHSFEMASTEVTQAQWKALGLNIPIQEVEAENTPVTMVNFFETLQWMNALSQLEGLDSCYDLSSCKGAFGVGCDDAGCSCNVSWEGGCEESPNIYYCDANIHKFKNWYECPGYRLPTTAEWEYAARSGTTTHTYNGDLKECIEGDTEYDDCSSRNFEVLDAIAWFRENSVRTIHPVAQKLPNQWGFYDMLGNVFEWVDYFTDGQPLDMGDGHKGEDLIDPIGPREGKNMDIRGGDFSRSYCRTRVAYQFPRKPYGRANDTGFRPVRTLFE